MTCWLAGVASEVGPAVGGKPGTNCAQGISRLQTGTRGAASLMRLSVMGNGLMASVEPTPAPAAVVPTWARETVQVVPATAVTEMNSTGLPGMAQTATLNGVGGRPARTS